MIPFLTSLDFGGSYAVAPPFLMMEELEQPIKTIQNWQEWYRKHKVVAEMDEPLVSKDSRENLHDTANVVDSMQSTSLKEMWIEKAREHFADTLAEYQYELTGKDFYKAFYQASLEMMEHAQKEYERAKELVDMLRYHHVGYD